MRNFLKAFGMFLLLNSIMHQGYSLLHRKPLLKFEIKALFRQYTTQTQKQKKTHSSIHTSLRTESSIRKYYTGKMIYNR